MQGNGDGYRTRGQNQKYLDTAYTTVIKIAIAGHVKVLNIESNGYRTLDREAVIESHI